MWENVEEAAAELRFVARGGKAVGTIDGHPVSVELSLLDQQTRLFVRCQLDPPLDLGLDMHRAEVVLIGLHSVQTGDPDLDAEFWVSGDDPRRTGALFAPEVCAHLVELHRAPFDFTLHDGGCSFFQPYGMGLDAAWIVRAAHVAARTATIVDEARRQVPPAEPLGRHAEAFRALAAARGLTLATAPLSLSGLVDGRPIEVGSARTGRGRHHLRVRASFAAELGLQLAVRRERLLDGVRKLLGAQDVLVGDEAFDRRFLIQAIPAQAARVPALLDAQVRAALLALDDRAGPITVDDAGVGVDPIDSRTDPETVLWAIDALDEARARIEHHLLHGAEGGPYR